MQRIGVFVCHCGTNIAGTVDVKAVAAALGNEPGVVVAEDYQYMCSQAGQDLIKKAINGDYQNEKRWISREDFFKLKEKDGYIKYCWSFSCAGINYLYSKEIEPWKKALHYARVLGDTSLFAEFGIKTDGSRYDIQKNKEEYKRKYIGWYLKNVLNSQADFEKLRDNLQGKIKKQKEELRLYLCDALEKSGLKQSDIDRRLNTQMSGHWFGRGQWQFPTREFYNKMREFLPLKDYDEVYGYAELLQSLQKGCAG